ncbi:saccharopine dehydrogenase [Caulobacter sp. Root656]|nr:saccharopine dehydrogenase [Caulobacter sp. Root656]
MSDDRKRIVLVGASGVFGQRLAAMIARWPDVILVLAARDRVRLEALAAELAKTKPAAKIEIARLDRLDPKDLADLGAWALVDAAGPFQGQDHAFPRAVLAARAHYLDLADARDFVAGFEAALEAPARTARRWAITGASSTPALSHAALDAMTAGWTRIDRIEAAISPGARAPRGLSVIRAILGWAGAPVRVFEKGRWTIRSGWSEPRRTPLPGLGRRWTSLAETPDLDLLPARFHPRRDAIFRAGLELPILHLGLWALSLLRRSRLVSTLEPLAVLLEDTAGWVAPLGSDRGGMVVSVEGLDADGARRLARWSLCAEAGAGPHTPAAPAAATLRALLDGRLGEPRATPCVGLVDLNAILSELGDLPIRTQVESQRREVPGLFPRLLGDAWDAQPSSVRQAHAGVAPVTLRGTARARGAPGLPALVRRLQGLPPTGRHATTVTITPTANGERWVRRFGARTFASSITADRDDPWTFEETAGVLTFRFGAAPYPGGFSWAFEGWRLGPIPLPRAWAPRIRARTFARSRQDGTDVYRFRVLVAHPWLGVIFSYAGRLS